MADPKNQARPDESAHKPVPGDKTRANADWNDDEGDEWRHAPVKPKDEGPLDSLGKAVSEVVTGAEADPSKGKKT